MNSLFQVALHLPSSTLPIACACCLGRAQTILVNLLIICPRVLPREMHQVMPVLPTKRFRFPCWWRKIRHSQPTYGDNSRPGFLSTLMAGVWCRRTPSGGCTQCKSQTRFPSTRTSLSALPRSSSYAPWCAPKPSNVLNPKPSNVPNLPIQVKHFIVQEESGAGDACVTFPVETNIHGNGEDTSGTRDTHEASLSARPRSSSHAL